MHHCPHCQRSYQRKLYYDRHVSVCEILCKSKRERRLEVEENADTPTVRDLYKVVMEMTVKYNQLEQKYQALSQDMAKLSTQQKPKISTLDWLNLKYSKAPEFTLWLNQLKVNRDDLLQLFKGDYSKGVISVLKQSLRLEDEERPLYAFTNKDNVFYLVEQKKWIMMSDEMYTKLMHNLDKKFMTEFLKWQTENKDNMYLDDFSLEYAKNVKKIMITREAVYSRIKRDLYYYLKITF
jgi:hypothetical protein